MPELGDGENHSFLHNNQTRYERDQDGRSSLAVSHPPEHGSRRGGASVVPDFSLQHRLPAALASGFENKSPWMIRGFICEKQNAAPHSGECAYTTPCRLVRQTDKE